MNHADMSVEDLRKHAGNTADLLALVQDLEAKTGIKFRLDLTGQPCVSFPLFPAAAVGEKTPYALPTGTTWATEPVEAPPVEPIAAPVAEKPQPVLPEVTDRPAWAVAIHAHLNALGYPGEWGPQLDFEMLVRLGRGDKFGIVAEELEIEKHAALARYNALIAGALDGDGRFGFEAQKRLTSVLRERADAAKAQAA